LHGKLAEYSTASRQALSARIGKRILSSLTISEALAPENEWLLNPYDVGTIEHDWFSDGYKSYLKAESKE
jgi:hypothetical protein